MLYRYENFVQVQWTQFVGERKATVTLANTLNFYNKLFVHNDLAQLSQSLILLSFANCGSFVQKNADRYPN